MRIFRSRAAKSTLVGLGLACHALLAPPAARAQITAPRELAQIEFGPVSVYPTLVVADAGKDSNVFNDNQAPKQDYTLTVQSRALVVTRLGLNELMFSVGSDYVWFRQYKQERSSNAAYAVRLNFSASRFKPFVGAQDLRLRSRPNPEIDARVRRLDRQGTGGLAFALTERTSINAAAVIDETLFDRGQSFQGVDLSQALNRKGRAYSGGVGYAVTPLTTLLLAWKYAEDRFPLSHLRDSKTYAFTPTLQFSPDAALRGQVSAGVEVFKPKDTQFARYRGATYDALLSWAVFSDRTTFDLRGSRNVSYSYKVNEPYYLVTGARLGVNQKFFGPFELTAGADREYLSYRWHQGVTGITDSNPRADTTDVLSGGIGINMKRGFKVALTAEKTRRHAATDPNLSFQRTRLLSTITIGS
jgi:Putative beta-barrel porin 2